MSEKDLSNQKNEVADEVSNQDQPEKEDQNKKEQVEQPENEEKDAPESSAEEASDKKEAPKAEETKKETPEAEAKEEEPKEEPETKAEEKPEEDQPSKEEKKAEPVAEEPKEEKSQEDVAEEKEKTPQAEKEEAKEEKKETREEEPEAKEEKTEEKKEEPKAEEPAKEKQTEEAGEAIPPVEEKPFSWDEVLSDTDDYSDKEREELEKMYEDTLTTIDENTIVEGTVEGVSDSDVVVNIGFKSDGLVSLSEFRDRPDLAEGDTVEVYVEKQEDSRGQLVLSRKKAKLTRAWEKIVDAHDNDKIIKGHIISKTKGGLIVDIDGLETFLPGSQIDVKPIIDYDAYVGKTMEFKVVKINEAIKNAVVSHKALIESDLEQQRQEIISTLEKGQVLEGTIKNLTDFGAFIDLGGVDGLLYITDISWGRINHPSEVLELNQEINVVVLDFDDEKKRISLGLKQLEPHPWDVLEEDLKEGSVVKGKIVNIEDYGAFLEIKPGVEGLIHVSEVSWSNQPINAKEFFNLGDEYEAKIVTIDREDRKMSLSIKQLQEDPWETIEDRYPINSKHTGVVRNITPYGVFVELDEYIGGMVHISDLSWTRRYNHPSEFTKVGEKLEVMVLEIDKDGRKIALGHKQLEEDPWDTFESVFPVNSVHEATLLRRDDKGGIVQLPYGLEAFAPNKHLKKEDGKMLEADETADFKVLEFDRDDKRIIVSHSRVHSDQVREAEEGEKKKKQTQTKRTSRKVEEINRRSERSTLGDLGVLEGLKEKMEETEKGDSKKTSAKKKEEKKEEEPAKEEKKAKKAGKEEKETEEKAEKKSEKKETKKKTTSKKKTTTKKKKEDTGDEEE